MKNRIPNLLVLGLAIACVAFLFQETFAQKSSKKYRNELSNAKVRVDSATEVLNEIMGSEDNAIPKDLLARAKAVVVFPGTLKGAFIIGGRAGRGVAVKRIGKSWSAPAFFNLGGGSFGFQIGGQKIDYILVVMNKEGLEGLLQDKFEIGGEASVAAGPVGRTAAASTNITLDAIILSYSRTQGLFAGVSLKGAVIKQDKSINKTLYNKSAKELFESNMLWSSAPRTLRVFPKTVARLAK